MSAPEDYQHFKEGQKEMSLRSVRRRNSRKGVSSKLEKKRFLKKMEIVNIIQ